ncbi:MAG TPA: TMEM175 family protein, partial [Longimicrobiales bacterium]
MSKTTESVRWRGGQVTRIEALTDAVFGFAITLLVVSLEVPETFDDLMLTMRGFVAFACSFALLILVWIYHYRLFSRFDLEDGYTIFLNSVLLFVVLFYVYPLKFVFSSWLNRGVGDIFTSGDQVRLMMTIYAIGFMAVFIVFALLYHHAYALRERLGLSRREALDARSHIADCLVMIGAGAASIVVTQAVPLRWAAPLGGMTYFLIGPAQFLNGRYWGRRIRELGERERNAVEVAASGADR